MTSGPQWFLNQDVQPDDTLIDVVVRFRIGSEHMELRRVMPLDGDEAFYLVARGVDGTTRHSHPDGAEIVWLGWTGPIERPVVSGAGNRLRARIAKMRNPAKAPRGYVG